MGIFQAARENPEVIRNEIDKQIINELMEEQTTYITPGGNEATGPMSPKTYEVEYKTGPDARAATNTDIVIANDIYVNEDEKLTFTAQAGVQLQFPAERLVSMRCLQNMPPFKGFLSSVQQEFVDDNADRIALLPRQSGATSALAATALDRAYNGSDVLYITGRRDGAKRFVQNVVHDVAIEMSVDVRQQDELKLDVGGRHIWADTYDIGNTSPLTARQPNVVLCDRLGEQHIEQIKPILEDSSIEETAMAATGGREVYGPSSAIRHALSYTEVENLYWFGEQALDQMNE